MPPPFSEAQKVVTPPPSVSTPLPPTNFWQVPYLAHQNDWRALNLTWCRSRLEASKFPSTPQDMIWLAKKNPSKILRQRTKKRTTDFRGVVEFPVLATMSRLLHGKIFCSYGSNFLKSHTFTKMTLRFSSQNLPRWRRFSLTSKKILQVAVVAGATTATVCGGTIYWSSGTIDSN